MKNGEESNQIIGISMTRAEAAGCLRACMAAWLIEDEVRVQQGLESLDASPVMNRLMTALGTTDDDADALASDVSDDLWAYSWYVFTSEWAWFRAQQDALRQSGAAAERLYRQNFDRYVREIDMDETKKARAEKVKKGK